MLSGFECIQFAYGGPSQNYGVLVHDQSSGQTACVDAGDADVTLEVLNRSGWSLTHLLITHHHDDHTAGLQAIKAATGCHVIGPEPLSRPIEGIDQSVTDNASLAFAGRSIRVLHTPGHTLDMMNYYFPEDALLFTGDTLFSMGCGRLFEGDAELMLNSLNKLAALPDDTLMYCAHEYTETNARFALDVDSDNDALRQRAAEVRELRADGQPTIPVSLAVEKQTNPFLRVQDQAIRSRLGLADASDVAVLAALREQRNRY